MANPVGRVQSDVPLNEPAEALDPHGLSLDPAAPDPTGPDPTERHPIDGGSSYSEAPHAAAAPEEAQPSKPPVRKRPAELPSANRVTREVYGSARNIDINGSPIERSEQERIRYYFYPTWRSQLLNLCGFAGLCVFCIVGSYYIPYVVIPGKLFSFYGKTVMLHLPVLILFPGFMLGRILVNIYDAKFIIDESGVEAQIGLVSFNLRQPRLRWEDIRGSEPQQTLWERLLGIGSVLVGSAMTQDVEIVMSGVANPRAIQLLIQGERDRRLKEMRAPGNNREYRVNAVMSD